LKRIEEISYIYKHRLWIMLKRERAMAPSWWLVGRVLDQGALE
jgi:hypothetical protein